MFERVTCKAFFKQCNIQAGKTVLQLELDPHYMGALPMLARLAGHSVLVEIESEQRIIFVNDGTDEVAEGQTSIYDEPEGEDAQDADDDSREAEPEEAAEEVEGDARDDQNVDYVDLGDDEDDARLALLDAEEE